MAGFSFFQQSRGDDGDVKAKSPEKDDDDSKKKGNDALAGIFDEEDDDGLDPDEMAALFDESLQDDLDDDEDEKKKKKKTADDDDDDDDTVSQQKETKELAAKIEQMISGMSVDSADIPDDFDITDAKQFQEVLTKTQQKSAVAMMSITATMLQQVMGKFTNDIDTKIQNALQQHGSQSSEQQILESIVPQSKNPKYAGMAKHLFDMAKQKSRDPRKAAVAVNKAFKTLGITDSGGSDSKSKDSSGGSTSYKTGMSALDAFAPLARQK